MSNSPDTQNESDPSAPQSGDDAAENTAERGEPVEAAAVAEDVTPAAEDPSPADVIDAEIVDAEIVDAEIVDAEIVELDPEGAGDAADGVASAATELALLRVEMAALQGQVASLKKDNDELTSRLRTVSKAYKQQQDDVAATRKRLERQAGEREAIRRGEVVKELFEPLQNLRRSKESMEKAEVNESHTQGVGMVIHQIMAAFERLGMEEVPGKGAKFDPNLHEALTMMPVQDPALDDVVVEVFEAGYRIGSRLIRPARVVVGKYTAPEEPVAEA